MIRHLIVLGLLLRVTSLQADTLTGRVVAVADGDTITVRDTARQQHRVWLAGIEAPKSKQPFAREAKRHLTGLLAGREVSIEWRDRDAYGRIAGKVALVAAACGDCTPARDAGLAQLEAGMAWWYRDYRREQSLADQGYYEYAEFDARNRRIGLWQDASPVPPWQWRKRESPSWQTRRHDRSAPEGASRQAAAAVAGSRRGGRLAQG